MSDIDAKLKSVLQPPFLNRIPIAPLWNIDISRISIWKTSDSAGDTRKKMSTMEMGENKTIKDEQLQNIRCCFSRNM